MSYRDKVKIIVLQEIITIAKAALKQITTRGSGEISAAYDALERIERIEIEKGLHR